MDWLDPQPGTQPVIEDPIFCQSCGCYVDRSDTPSGPDKFCPSEVCGCHSPYWATVAESTKRSLWGDR